jgi:predicted metal-dependent HD superfamily phosphohydrolase
MIQIVKEKYWTPLESTHSAGAWEALAGAYGAPNRAYHSWSHIADLLEKLDKFSRLAVRKDLVASACFWHDAVYAACDEAGGERSDAQNVRDSASLFKRYASMDAADAEAVLELIMATINPTTAEAARPHYEGFPGDLDLFLDLDLSSLGAPWPQFETNFQNIRFECAHLSERDFFAGRILTLEGFARLGDRLFRRRATREEWGAPAAANLARCTRELRRRLDACS